ncbi:MAG: sulfite exporter TauE/SafE family protein [Micavibrio aeruginosavorus]|uniref:Probable membrane transporter protein n=1 Tax=Micavibrio aeruginosavorus TaxID=349221 RepID=A0A2W4ZET0_9BACT|nr:MAG: sulfite exporter TauE/SafE family protein [Micavibrio aeruginosavorus]
MQDLIAHAPVLFPLLLALGASAGFLAGLLGIGGGIVLVPGLYFLFKTLGYAEASLMHLAVGTSLAIIIPTGISSARAHYRKGAVRMDIVKMVGPGILLGVAAGTVIADHLSGAALTIVFAGALLLFAAMMQIPPKVRDEGHAMTPVKGSAGGFVIGGLSSLMGIGGATLNVPFMTLNGVPIHQAVGSSSALGPVIALPGTIGFILIGLGVPGLPPFSLGYINLLAVCVIAPLSVVAAPYGAALAHSVSVKTLRRVFSAFIIIVAVKMIWEASHG